ncbi:hypothetical protein cyc_08590 [Cyclospora cayetanensis]|uniref:Rhodanese domain-containing protein n=1 Tax=Cyclospora cayetanensis TaxID=88456 RepID=A0A1D3CYM5_9EIME|nr:hypothetical protein cyc_08590 [Cyclospora cayetanensis]
MDAIKPIDFSALLLEARKARREQRQQQQQGVAAGDAHQASARIDAASVDAAHLAPQWIRCSQAAAFNLLQTQKPLQQPLLQLLLQQGSGQVRQPQQQELLLLLDLRSASDYEASHIAQAVHVQQLQKLLPSQLPQEPQMDMRKPQQQPRLRVVAYAQDEEATNRFLSGEEARCSSTGLQRFLSALQRHCLIEQRRLAGGFSGFAADYPFMCSAASPTAAVALLRYAIEPREAAWQVLQRLGLIDCDNNFNSTCSSSSNACKTSAGSVLIVADEDACSRTHVLRSWKEAVLLPQHMQQLLQYKSDRLVLCPRRDPRRMTRLSAAEDEDEELLQQAAAETLWAYTAPQRSGEHATARGRPGCSDARTAAAATGGSR